MCSNGFLQAAKRVHSVWSLLLDGLSHPGVIFAELRVISHELFCALDHCRFLCTGLRPPQLKKCVILLLLTLLSVGSVGQFDVNALRLLVGLTTAVISGIIALFLLRDCQSAALAQRAGGLVRSAWILFFVTSATAAFAQMQPNLENGFKNYDSIHGTNIDTVNLMNGNWMLHAPVIPDVPQRGDFALHYFVLANSKSWQIVCQSNTNDPNGIFCYWQPGGAGAIVDESYDVSVHRTVDENGSGTGTVTYSAYGYTINTADGATHQMYPIPGTQDSTGEATQFESIDTTGLYLVLNNPDTNGIEHSGTVTDRQGTQYTVDLSGFGRCGRPHGNELPKPGNVAPVIDDAPFGDNYCSQTGHTVKVTDRNGNFMIPPMNAPFVDTLGRSPLGFPTSETTDYTGCSTNTTQAYLYSYSAPDGSTQQVKACYAYIPFQTAFNAAANGVSVIEAQNYPSNYNSVAGNYSTLQLVTLVLADGSAWTFNYDNYLEVTSVGLPTGGSIALTWTTINFSSCTLTDPTYLSRAVASRTLNDNNAHSYTWNYSWGTPSNGSLVNTVTDPLGNDTVHSFTALSNQQDCGFYETRTQSYQGTGSSRQLLQQVDTAYSSAMFGLETTALGLGNVVPTSIQATVYPSGNVKLVKKSYDTGLGSGAPIFGNVTQELDYDWGSGSPGPLVKETDSTYEWQQNNAYLSAGMVDLPASVIVKDGGGNKLAESDYTYDESQYLTSSGVTTQHGAPPSSVRGNPTTLSKWLNTSSNPVAGHSNWYDTGELSQAIDPLGNTTTHSYSSTFYGAYPTQTCNALNQCVGGNYDFNTGVLTSFTDANGNTSNYSYDFMSRLTSAQLPADPNGNRPQTSFTYSPPNKFPLNVQRTKSITASLNDVATNYFDGFGRVYQGQHATPNGNATVVTTYDAFDHPISVTNPYYSTSDPTYGVIQNQYDALGRVTQTTKQDGSITTAQYDQTAATSTNGDCTVTTDEVGNQHKTCSDGLGRLIEVDEPMGGSPALAATGSGSITGTEQSTQVVQTPAQPGTGSVQVGGAIQWKTVSNASTGGTTNITITGAEQQYPAGIIAGAGSVTISGAEQVIPAVAGTGSVSISGTLQSKQVQTKAAVSASITLAVGGADGSYTVSVTSCSGVFDGRCTGTRTTTSHPADSGNMQYSVSAGGVVTTSAKVSYNGSSTASGLAQSLAGALPSNSYVSVSWNGNNSFTITAAAAGTGGNSYSASIAAVSSCASGTSTSGSGISQITTTISCGSQGWNFSSNTGSGAFANGANAVYETVYDSGLCTVTVNNRGDSNSWSGSGTTAAGIASSLVSAITNDGSASVAATLSSDTVKLTAKTTGAATNYVLSAGCTYDSSNFSGPSFTTTASGSALTGGKNAIYDAGTASITVDGHTDSVNFNNSSTPATIASALASAINGDTGAAVTATVSNATVSLTATTKGTISNYPMSAAVTYDTTDFKQSSFAAGTSGAALTGGWPNPQAVDSGTMTVTVNGNAYQVNWGQNDTPGSIAANLAAALKASGAITPTLSGATIYLDPQTPGASYSFSTAYTYDTTDFTQSSFNTSNSVSDYGTATITVNGHNDSVSFAGHDTPTTIVAGLASAIQSDHSAVVNATASESTVSLTATTDGAQTNYSLASSASYDSAHFGAGSFTTGNSGTALAGGANTVYKTVYDTGEVWLAVDAFEVSVPYQQGSSGNGLATSLANAINGAGSPSPVTASVSGSTLTLTAIQPGSAGNYSVTSGSSTSQSGLFSAPSFSASWTNSALAGGVDSGPGNLSSPSVTLYTYDGLGNLTCAVQKGADTSSFNGCASAPATWRPRSFTYDSLSRLLTATNPESGQVGYLYDADGNLLQKTSPAPNQVGTAAQTVSYCYDALNRVTGRAYSAQTCQSGGNGPESQLPSGTEVVGYSYDGGANGIGHLTSLTDQAGSASYTYDGLGRMATEQRTIAGITQSMGYDYNLDNSIADLTYPNGSVITYTVDGAGRMVSAVDAGNNISYVTNATYAADNSLTGFLSGNTITNSFSYNSRLQPLNMSAVSPMGTVFSINYDFHAGNGNNGNVFGIVNNRDNTRTQAFTYDTLNRLITAQNAGTDCTQTTPTGGSEYWGNSYAYDAWGNLLEKQITKCSAESLSLSADNNNRIHTGAAPDYAYDASGNMTYDATSGNTYAYDPENRITGAGGFTYTYGADGNRVEKSNGGAGTIYWYMAPGIVAKSDLSGNLTSEYVFFGGERVARRDFPSNAVSYYFSDDLKTADVITNSAGTITEDEDYYPWGGEIQFANNDSNRYKFTGKERDAETGLDYFGARYYGNWLGRFVTPDVPGLDQHRIDAQSWNLYTYERNNPLRFTDPTGNYVCGSSMSAAQCTSFQGSLDNAQKAADKLRDQYGADSSKYKEAQRAIDAYGKGGVDNGVTIQVGATPGGASTVVFNRIGPTTADNPTGQKISVTFAEANLGVDSLAAHEGVHVADGSAWVASGFSAAMNPTKYAGEMRAFLVQASIKDTETALGAYSTIIMGDKQYLFSSPMWSEQTVRDNITDILAVPRRDSGEYEVAPNAKALLFTQPHPHKPK